MTTPAEEFLALPLEKKRSVHVILCERALEQWTAFARGRREMTYTESVCGTSQLVDRSLPADALASAKQGRDIRTVSDRYREPVTALQDQDLKFPDNIDFAYYALYNLFRKYVEGKTIDDWIIVNQALSAEPDQDRVGLVLRLAISQANGLEFS